MDLDQWRAYFGCAMDAQWWSIEVMNGPFSADRWRDAHGRALFEAAVTHGALDWSWQSTAWGPSPTDRSTGISCRQRSKPSGQRP